MRISMKGQYGVRAMFDLASHFKDGPVPLRQISEREEISLNYLEQLFLKLRKSGLVESVRGPGGGYLLKKKPKEIRISDIVRAVEEPLAPASCLEPEKVPRCHRMKNCVARSLWQRLGATITQVLDSTTLSDLCKEAASARSGSRGSFKVRGVKSQKPTKRRRENVTAVKT